MRTKTFLLSAAVFAAGVAVSSAQSVYSVNAVGYVNLVVTNGYNLVANPLNGTNNNLNTIIPTAPNDSLALRWSVPQQKFVSTDTYVSGVAGLQDGWYDLGAGTLSPTVLAPGEAFFLKDAAPGTTTLTFVGEVPQGNLVNPIGPLYGFYSSIVPQEATFSAMGFPGRNDMTYTEWDSGAQKYVNLLNYVAGVAGLPDGWYDIGAGIQKDPQPKVGQGFLIFNPAANGTVNWSRTFSVN